MSFAFLYLVTRISSALLLPPLLAYNRIQYFPGHTLGLIHVVFCTNVTFNENN